MKAKSSLWTCPTCGRKFERKGQAHSCEPFPLSQHFKGKPLGKNLYETLIQSIKKGVATFKIESLHCCIHLVSTFTFAAVKIYKNKIQVEFSLNKKIESKRIKRIVQTSAHRFLYYADVMNAEDIDKELIEWVREAHESKKQKEVIG
jgi:hypothetical protein